LNDGQAYTQAGISLIMDHHHIADCVRPSFPMLDLNRMTTVMFSLAPYSISSTVL
jgi:hypothetical protein